MLFVEVKRLVYMCIEAGGSEGAKAESHSKVNRKQREAERSDKSGESVPDKRTGITKSFSYVLVTSLNCLQKSAMLRPRGPSA
jgi:hypothetical protein